MMLTTKGRYSVMALVYMAIHNERAKPINIAEISIKKNIPINYLEQIFIRLRRAGLVKSSKGPGGGYTLAKRLEDIFVIDIIDAVEEDIKITRCSGKTEEDHNGCMPGNRMCVTHSFWEALGETIRNYLSSVSLKDFESGKFIPKPIINNLMTLV